MDRKFRVAVGIVLGILFASIAPAQVRADGPATRPTAPPKIGVAVLPFDVIGSVGHEWVGRAIAEGLATGVQKDQTVRGIIVPAVAPVELQSALSAGKSAGANYVIVGSIQFLENEMRASARVISVETGQGIGALKADGNLTDLFSMEDLLADRAQRMVLATRTEKLTPPLPHKPVGPPPGIEMVGLPMGAAGVTRYFDGSQVGNYSQPDRYQDEYNNYYYHSGSSTYGYGYYGYLGYGYSTCGYGGCGYGAGLNFSPVVTIGTW